MTSLPFLALLLPLAIGPGLYGNTDIKFFLLLLGAILVVGQFLWFGYKQGSLRLASKVVWVPCLAWGTWVCLVSAFRPASNKFLLVSQIANLVLFWVAIHEFSQESHVRRFLKFWQAATIPVAIYYLLQRMGYDFSPQRPYDQNPIGSFLDNRNFLFYYLVGYLPFAVYLCETEKKWQRLLSAFTAVLVIACFVVSDSRAGQGIFVIFAVWVVRSKLSEPWRKRLDKLLLVLAMISLLGLLAYLKSVPHTVFVTLDQMSHWRLTIWQSALRLFAESPWIGHGCGSFAVLFPGYQPPHFGFLFDEKHQILAAHSVPIDLLCEYGIGGMLLLAMLVGSAWRGRLNVASGTPTDPLRNATLLSLGAFALFSCIAEVANVVWCTFFSWMVLAMLFRGHPEQKLLLVRWRGPQLALAGFTLWLCLVGVGKAMLADYHLGQALKAQLMYKDVGRANRELARSLKLWPDNPRTLYQRAGLAAHQGDLPRAEQDYKTILQSYPYFGSIHSHLGIVLAASGQDSQAIVELTIANRQFPTSFAPPYMLAKIHARNGRATEARQWCDYLTIHSLQNTLSAKLCDSVSTR